MAMRCLQFYACDPVSHKAVSRKSIAVLLTARFRLKKNKGFRRAGHNLPRMTETSDFRLFASAFSAVISQQTDSIRNLWNMSAEKACRILIRLPLDLAALIRSEQSPPS